VSLHISTGKPGVGFAVVSVSDLAVVVKVPIGKVKPYEKNPRRIPDRAVEITAESLKRFGWQQPLVVDRDYVLVVGHVRFQAAKSLGLKHVPVVVADQLTQDEIDAYRIADNRTHDYTTWDYPELVDALDALAEEFSDVLGLADWAGIVDDFDDLYGIDVPDDVQADAEGGFAVVVVFVDKGRAESAQQQLIDLDGVIDVRYKE
jgi:ParB-like chromosome segregation protein Spo0J